MVRDVLYFGRNRPGGGTVNHAEWEGYLDSVVTPRFPAGFTVAEAEGHWRGESGVASRRAVQVIAEEYISRFRQEALLRERLPPAPASSADARRLFAARRVRIIGPTRIRARSRR